MNSDYICYCDNPHCRELPEFIDLDNRHVIKNGTLVAIMEVGTSPFRRNMYFCRDCIDLVCQDIKKTMDSSLWAFH